MSSPAETPLRNWSLVAGRLNAVQLRVVLFLMAFAFLCHFNRVGMSVAGTERLMHEFEFSEEQMGAVYSAYLLVYTLLMIPGGWLIERVGPRWALGCMGIGSTVLVVLTGLPGWGLIPAAAALPAFLLIRGMLGAVTAPMHPGAARAIALWVPATVRARGNGLVTGAAALGIAATYYLFGHLMDSLTWPGAFLAAGLATAVLTGAWLLTTTDRPSEPALEEIVTSSPDSGQAGAARAAERSGAIPPDQSVAGLTSIVSLLRDRSLLLIAISYGAYGYFQYLFFYWIEFYFHEILSLSTEMSRFYSTIAILAMGVGMVAGGFCSDRLQGIWGARRGRAAVAIGGMVASALFAIAGIHLEQPGWVVVCFALAMGALGMCEGPFWTTAVDLGGSRGGLAAAILNTGGNIGGTMAPFATPLFAHYFNWRAGIELGCLFCALGAALWLWIKPGENADAWSEPK
jgi:sugar phosphate permease